MARGSKVARPTKRSEYSIEYASSSAQRGWTDLCATIRGPLVDAWDFLTRTPLSVTPTNYPLKGDARIWFYVHEQVVYLEEVHTHHPNATK